MLFCHIKVALFPYEKIRYFGIYFPRNFIKHVMMVEAIKCSGKYMTICLIPACEKEAIYMWKNSILILYINTFQRKVFTKFERRCEFLTPLMLNRTLLSMDFCYWSRLRMRVIGMRAADTVHLSVRSNALLMLWYINIVCLIFCFPLTFVRSI